MMMSKKHHWSIRPPRGRSLLIGILILTNAISAALLVRSWWRSLEADNEILAMASYAGAMQSAADFRNGVLRQYELVSDKPSGFTGRRAGPFEVWTWTYYPVLGPSDRLANNTYIDTYNSKMKFMHGHPDQFRPGEMGGHNASTRP